MFSSVGYNLRNLMNFNGRDPRPTFWWYVLFVFVVHMIASIISGVMVTMKIAGAAISAQGLPDAGPSPEMMQVIVDALEPQMMFGTVLSILSVILLGAAFVRRLHDGGFSGWIAGVTAVVYLANVVLGWMTLGEVKAAMLAATTPEQLEAAAFTATGPLSLALGWLPIIAFVGFGVMRSQTHDNRWGEYVPPAARPEKQQRPAAHMKTDDD